MSGNELTLNSWLAIAPEIALTILLFIILAYGAGVKNADGRKAGIMTAWGAFAILVGTIVMSVLQWAEITNVTGSLPNQHWGGMVAFDPIGIIFRVMFILALIFTALISLDTPELRRADYFALLIAATIGFNLMSVSTDMIILILALETASISMYLLAGYVTRSKRSELMSSNSAEAGVKYFVYGAFASAVMLYGISLLYGATGQTNFYKIANEVMALSGSPEMTGLILLSALLLLAGLGFKVSIVPFHWWAPDVYEGAPTAVTGFASTASKAAGFALLFRVFLAGTVGTPTADEPWWKLIMIVLCLATMILGNLLAITQTNIKRMLAYSSVAQAGYVLIGLLTLTKAGAGAAMFYLLVYVLTNIVAFGVISLASNLSDSDDMEKSIYGLNQRSTFLAIAMTVALLSLGGIPPTGGFMGKFFLFKAAVEADLAWLAIVGILMAFVSLYYYLSVIKYIFFKDTAAGDTTEISISVPAKFAITMCLIGIVLLGLPVFGTIQDLTLKAAEWFFPLIG